MSILKPEQATFVGTVPVVIIGGGGCGLTAALAAKEGGAEPLVIERDPTPLGTTSMSTGLIPGVGSKQQKARGIDDSAEIFAADIMKKARGQTDPEIALALARESGRTIDWLTESHGVPFSFVDSFLYPGHSRLRMHGTPKRTGSELMGALTNACTVAGIDILTEALATHLFADETGRIHGVRLQRPDGTTEDLGCEALILACCGFAGNAEMVAELIPEAAAAVFHGHPGNKGDAIRWGRALGAKTADLLSYQGHGGLAYGYGVPILWPVIMEGGFQVNLLGQRFSNEALGYSEQAAVILAQPDHVAWTIFDERLHKLMLEFDDYHDALQAGAVKSAADIAALGQMTQLPPDQLQKTVADVEAMTLGKAADGYGRDFTGKPPLQPPFYAVKVTGALFHTQGGLVVDERARVRREDGALFPNLFAGGGAARGISGPSSWGYMAGHGLLTATTFGRLAGETSAELVRKGSA
jgi:fumarate reductase flavoprotein subunit